MKEKGGGLLHGEAGFENQKRTEQMMRGRTSLKEEQLKNKADVLGAHLQ
jgi:hypothetical protein